MRTYYPFAACVWLTLIGFAICSAAGEIPPNKLNDPQWWFEQARAEVSHISDPEERHLVGQLLSSMRSEQQTPDQVRERVDRELAEARKQREVSTWQAAMFAANQFANAHMYREAFAELERAKAELPTLPEEQRRQVREEVDRQISSAISSAATHGGEIALALAKCRQHEPDHSQAHTLRHIAHVQAQSDMAAAEAIMREVGDGKTELLHFRLHYASRSAAAFTLAVEQLLEHAPSLTGRELEKCYRLNFPEQELSKVDPALLDRFQEQLSQSIEKETTKELQREARRCLVDLLFAQGRLDESLAVAEGLHVHAQSSLKRRVAAKLAAQGKLEEAVALSSDVLPLLAERHLKEGNLDEGLAVARNLEDVADAYPLVVEAARLFADQENAKGIKQALHDLVYDDLRAHCLADLAMHEQERGRPQRACELLKLGEAQIGKVADKNQIRNAAQKLSAAYAAVGDDANALRLLREHVDPPAQAHFLLGAARKRLQTKDVSGFDDYMNEFEKLWTAGDFRFQGEVESYHAPRNVHEAGMMDGLPFMGGQQRRPRTPRPVVEFPPSTTIIPIGGALPPPADIAPPAAPLAPGERVAPADPNRERRESPQKRADELAVRVQFAVEAARLYHQAGEHAKARAMYERGLKGSGDASGAFWRFEMYATLFADPPSPENREQIAELCEVAPRGVDRAILLALGGAITNHLNEKSDEQKKEAHAPRAP
jgi:hypothetical protein